MLRVSLQIETGSKSNIFLNVIFFMEIFICFQINWLKIEFLNSWLWKTVYFIHVWSRIYNWSDEFLAHMTSWSCFRYFPHWYFLFIKIIQSYHILQIWRLICVITVFWYLEAGVRILSLDNIVSSCRHRPRWANDWRFKRHI